eukprot:TRINITY_DN7509_c0_g7_i1.p1 TRINITY_DN7509_c0_g7~~TRINITY_DN7509_c0_g7_i1.p1  ORF type:complete len:176 (+),score=41.94 TRINITY_DN7509_c0_g7_i1:58-585(+)
MEFDQNFVIKSHGGFIVFTGGFIGSVSDPSYHERKAAAEKRMEVEKRQRMREYEAKQEKPTKMLLRSLLSNPQFFSRVLEKDEEEKRRKLISEQDEKLLRAEKENLEKLQLKTDSLIQHVIGEAKGDPPCIPQRDAAIKCYAENKANVLLCREIVHEFAKCSQLANKGYGESLSS